MRKWLLWLLAAVMLLTALPGVAEETAVSALPATGDVIHGFEVLEIREEPMLGAQLVYMRHQQTGAEALWIANDSTDRYFALAFDTKAIDDTGLPHVFEHATLSGSEKYPSTELFWALSSQTYQTYMNASTSDAMTLYPVGSLSSEQLLKLADFYTDSCFHPMVLQDESIYRTEAWRYRLESADAPLTIEGTVYSEMLGALTLERRSYKNYVKTVFPGSWLIYEQGGDPAAIPEMTWDDLKAYHDLFYHPSNCTAYLYGDLDNYADFLALLDAEFSQYEAREFVKSDEGYTPLTENVTASYPVAVSASTDVTHKSVINYTFVLPEEGWADRSAIDYMCALFSDRAGTLSQTLQAQLPHATLSVGQEIASPVPAIIFSLFYADPEDAEPFCAAVENAIAEVMANGFPAEQVDAYAASASLSKLLTLENTEISDLIHSIAYSKSTSGNVWFWFDSNADAENVVQWNSEGVFAGLCEKYLNADAIRGLDVTYPVPGQKEQDDAALAEHLAEVKAAMSEEEIAALVEATNNPAVSEADTAGMLKSLTAVDVSSLPEEIRMYDYTDETDENGVRHIDVPAGVTQVSSADISLSASSLSAEDLLWLKLCKDLIPYLDTDAHTRAEIATLRNRLLYDDSIGIRLIRQDGEVHPYLSFSWIGLDDDMADAYALMGEMFFHLNLNDPDRLREGVSALMVSTRAGVNNSPYSEVIYRSMGRTSERYRYSAFLGGVSYYDFLQQVSAALDAQPEAVVAALQDIQARMWSREQAVTLFAGDETSIAINRALADAWLAEMPADAREDAHPELPTAAESEAIIVDSNVQFNGLVASYEQLGMEGYNSALDVVTTLVNDQFLTPMLRDGYGVYGILHGAFDKDGVYVCTYRDPNVLETFQLYAQLPELVASLELTQEDIDGYILSNYAYLATPEGELSGAVSTAGQVLAGEDLAEPLTRMQQLKETTPEKVAAYADMYQKLSENGSAFTAGSAGKINENAAIYTSILNPFGAVDTSKVELTDVAEDDPSYTAIRFAFENGLMQLAGENTFDKAGETDVGDLAAFINAAAITGNYDREEGVANLKAYGMLPAELNAGDALTRGQTAESVYTLLQLMDVELSVAETPEVGDAEQMSTAMAWCLENGILAPVEGDSPLAAPEQVLSREELANVIYLLMAE